MRGVMRAYNVVNYDLPVELRALSAGFLHENLVKKREKARLFCLPARLAKPRTSNTRKRHLQLVFAE